jgi:hypothetical protein
MPSPKVTTPAPAAPETPAAPPTAPAATAAPVVPRNRLAGSHDRMYITEHHRTAGKGKK